MYALVKLSFAYMKDQDINLIYIYIGNTFK